MRTAFDGPDSVVRLARIEVPDYLLLRYNLKSVKPDILESLEKKDQRCPP